MSLMNLSKDLTWVWLVIDLFRCNRNAVIKSKTYSNKKSQKNLSANIDENVKPPKRRVWESLFCCWRQRSVSISSRRSKSIQNGSIDGLQTQTIGQATGLTGSGGQNRYLLPQIRHSDMHKKCMVIDLDETLVHSSFKVSRWMFLFIKKQMFNYV